MAVHCVVLVLRQAVCMGSEDLGQQWKQFGARQGISMSFVVAADPSAATGGGSSDAAGSAAAAAATAAVEAPPIHSSTSATYFESYEQMSVHELMLKDRPRTETYRDAIFAAIARVAQERRAAAELGVPVVAVDEPIRMVDVGAGTGILCMCAAAAAAKQQVPIQIVAIEGSRMAEVATALIAQNGFAEVITVVHGAVEDLSTLPGCRGGDVDIIVSEWMGFYLLHESMLSSVLVARDRWLRPGGLMLPSHANIYAAPLSLGRSLGWWKDVYGFDYSPVVSRVLEEAATHNPQCDRVVDAADVMADGQLVAAIDCTTVTVASLAVIRYVRRLCRPYLLGWVLLLTLLGMH
jgi:protein arginine N-methyltransferase 6